MGLPVVPIPRDSVELGGQLVEFRSLTRLEVLKISREFGDDLEGGEVFGLACGVDCSEEEARAWLASSDPTAAAKLIDAILTLSGLKIKDTDLKA